MMKRCLVGWILWFLLIAQAAWAGSYLDSAHGDPDHGVDRSHTEAKLAAYARGNCAHCHEMHASMEGSEPAPASGSPAPFCVFAQNFNTSVNTGPYQEADNFCFYCHNSSGSAQQVDNYDYSRTFGCEATGGPTSILNAFNQTSYHNLYDIYDLARGKFSWFKDHSNPCVACHNAHLARRNWSDPDNPLLTAISRPSEHFGLWGNTELMLTYSYEAPYCSGVMREPGGTGAQDGSKTPDYVGLCTDCHDRINTINSTSLGRNLKQIDWSSLGDKHGQRDRDSSNSTSVDFVEPYLAASATNGNFVLSCMDCHEPHGAPNIMLIRRRVNGGNLEGAVSSSSNTLGYLCTRCHKDDADAGIGLLNEWKFVHHNSGDAPYPAHGQCGHCHGMGGGGMEKPPIPCLNCHFHNGNDNWLNSVGELPTGRITF